MDAGAVLATLCASSRSPDRGSIVRRIAVPQLLPLVTAIVLHATALVAIAFLWHAAPQPVALGARRAPSDPVRFVLPVLIPIADARQKARERKPERSTSEPQPSDAGTPASPNAEPMPSEGGTASVAEGSTGPGWAYRPAQPSSRFTEATSRSVMSDLPARPNCAEEHLQQFHCAQLQSRWSLDSSISVNLNCARVTLSRQRYAECVRHPMVAVDTSPMDRSSGESIAPE